MTSLETPRLRLRPFRAEDLDPYAAMCADPEVMRYVGDRAVLSRDDAWRQLAMLAGHWLAWALARPYRGRGYALEAARAALEEAFGRLGWSRVISLIDPANARSVRLAERLGERLTGTATVRGHCVSVHALERAAWSVSQHHHREQPT